MLVQCHCLFRLFPLILLDGFFHSEKGFLYIQYLVIFLLVWRVITSKKPKKQIEIVSKNRDLCRKEKWEFVESIDFTGVFGIAC